MAIYLFFHLCACVCSAGWSVVSKWKGVTSERSKEIRERLRGKGLPAGNTHQIPYEKGIYCLLHREMKMGFHPRVIKHVHFCFLLLSFFHPHTLMHTQNTQACQYTLTLLIFQSSFASTTQLELLLINYDILIVITAHAFSAF